MRFASLSLSIPEPSYVTGLASNVVFTLTATDTVAGSAFPAADVVADEVGAVAVLEVVLEVVVDSETAVVVNVVDTVDLVMLEAVDATVIGVVVDAVTVVAENGGEKLVADIVEFVVAVQFGSDSASGRISTVGVADSVAEISVASTPDVSTSVV